MGVIGLMGKISAGKTTSADFLTAKYGYIEYSFATPLKDACRNLFLLTNDQLYGSKKELPDNRWFDCTPRKILQYVGTDLLRDNMDKIMPGLGKNIFIHIAKLWYEETIKTNPNANIVISDVRFQNEVEFLHSIGGIVVKINRNQDEILSKSSSHSSEIELDKITNYDKIIDNNDNIEYLFQELSKIHREYVN